MVWGLGFLRWFHSFWMFLGPMDNPHVRGEVPVGVPNLVVISDVKHLFCQHIPNSFQFS